MSSTGTEAMARARNDEITAIECIIERAARGMSDASGADVNFKCHKYLYLERCCCAAV